MSTSADDHTEEGVEGVQIARSSMYDSESQLDDDCVSENSFGSDFGDNAMDEENMTADIELDSSLPVYLNEKYPESTSALDDMLLPVYVRSPSVDLTVTAAVARVLPPSQYHDTPPTRSTQPALNAMFSGPSMCVVCKLSPAYSKGGVSYPTCGLRCASKIPEAPSSTSQSEISYSMNQGSVSQSQGGASQVTDKKIKMCEVCQVRPQTQKAGKSYPTCGFTCTATLISSPTSKGNVPTRDPLAKLSLADHSPGTHHSPQQSSRADRHSASQVTDKIKMCEVCQVRPQAQKAGKSYPTCGFTCTATLTSSPTSKGNVPTRDQLVKLFPKLSLADHSPGTHHSPQQSSRADRHISHGQHSSHSHSESPRGITQTAPGPTDRYRLSQVHQPLKCVICRKPYRDERYVTCGMKCADTLCTRGNRDSESNPKMCDYCHRRPKVPGHNQCGNTCRDKASTACLLCRCRPKFGRYHLCGRTCKMVATKRTPLILEARPDHITYIEVERRFKRAWKGSDVCPSIKKVYKIIENKSFLLPYDQYKRRVGNEVFRYHGTSRRCTLGSLGNTRLCSSTACALCSILRTSFNVSLANPFGAFGAGVYTSSAANKAYSYSDDGAGAIILTKVVLGTVYEVKAFNEVMSCPRGHNSVVFNRQNGILNETIVYTNDAIRPVFLIIF